MTPNRSHNHDRNYLYMAGNFGYGLPSWVQNFQEIMGISSVVSSVPPNEPTMRFSVVVKCCLGFFWAIFFFVLLFFLCLIVLTY